MTTLTIDEVQRNASAVIRRVVAGETIVIVDNDHAVAEIKPILDVADQARPYGLAKGQFLVPDDFDAPLSEDELRLFEGRDL